MITPINRNQVSAQDLESVIALGDLKGLTSEQRIQYYNRVCESLSLNPLTKPFEYITLSGKLTLYANKGCAEQLRSNNKISVQVVSRELIGEVYVVTARAKMPDGREDESTGAVAVGGLKGEALANAYMKTETKAKRRVTLSICGLNMLDESEIPDVGNAKMAEKTKEVHEAVTSAPAQVDFDPGEFVVPCARYKGKKLKELTTEIVRENLNYWRDRESKGEELGGQILDFVRAMEAHLKV